MKKVVVRDRRVASLKISSQLFPHIFMKGKRCYEVVNGHLPDDAVLINIRIDLRGDIVASFTSKEFKRIKIGEEIPELDIPTLKVERESK